MCLIHNNIADIHHLQITLEQTCTHSLRRNIQKFEVTVSGIIQGKFDLTPAHAGIDT